MGLRLVIILLLLALPSCASARRKSLDVRPITLKVVDARTGQPLPGISVHYALETVVFQKYILLFIPNIEPDIGRKIAYKAHQRTDANGEVTFHVQGFELPGNERLEDEYMFINLDVDMAHPRARRRQESIADYYRKTRVKRSGPVDNIDIMYGLRLENSAARIEVFRNPDPEHKGVILISVASDPNEGRYDWTVEKDKFRVRWNFASLRKEADAVVVQLEPSEAGAK